MLEYPAIWIQVPQRSSGTCRSDGPNPLLVAGFAARIPPVRDQAVQR